MSSFTQWFFNLNPTLAVIGLMAVYGFYLGLRYFFGLHFGSKDEPILSAAQLLGGGGLTPLHVGSVQGYTYSFIAAQDGRITIIVYLQQNTFMHVVAIGDQSGLDSKLSTVELNARLNKVELEGDFPKRFSLYCTPGAELELLQLFDPGDMAYFVDFCRAYDFELYRDTIYIFQAADANSQGDTTVLITDIESFLVKNKILLDKLQDGRATAVQSPE